MAFGDKIYRAWVLAPVLMGWVGSFGLYCIMLMFFTTTFVSHLRRFYCVFGR